MAKEKKQAKDELPKKEEQPKKPKKVKATTGQIVNSFMALNNATIGNVKEKSKLMKLIMAFKKVNEEWQQFLEELNKRINPEGIDEIQAQLQRGETLTPADQMKWDDYVKELDNAGKEEFERERELDCEFITDTIFDNISFGEQIPMINMTTLYSIAVKS